MTMTNKASVSVVLLVVLLSITTSLSFVPTFAFSSPGKSFGMGSRVKYDEGPMRAHSGDFGSFKDNNDEDENSDEFEGQGIDSSTSSWKLYNDFRLFITQCSVQSFMFLLKNMRDPQTIIWMENFTQPAIHLKKETTPHALPSGGSADSQLLNYHGLHAMNATLFPNWDSYFSELLEQPQQTFIIESHFKQFPDYELEINPVRLCSRLLAVREQISREFVKDLTVIANMTSRTLKAYKHSRMKTGKDGKVKLERENLMFLELSVSGAGLSPSPLRKGNFDLLMLLSTQEAFHRVLNDPERQKGADAMGNRFLKDFYVKRLVSHFSGSQRYGRADDLVEELFTMSPMLQVHKAETTLVNPAGMAEVVLKAREQVALEWTALAQQVPDEHLEIQRLSLNQMLSGGTGTSFEDALRGQPNVFPTQDKKEERKEVVQVGGKDKHGPFDLLSLPPMSVLWNDDRANIGAPGVFE